MSKLLAILSFIILTSTQLLATTLSGIVYGESDPLPNSTVSILLAGSSNIISTTTSDASGFYTFNVTNNTYDLKVTPPVESLYTQTTIESIVVNGSDVV